MSDVRGYAKWEPKAEAARWVRLANKVLEHYGPSGPYATPENPRGYWPLSTRQVFYRMVAEFAYPKSEKDYDRLSQMLSRARRAQMVGWDAIRDGGLGRTIRADYYRDQDHFERSVVETARQMQMDRQRGQDRVVELWCEAGGMVPILQGIAHPYSCQVSTGGGYDSVTAKHNLAIRAATRAEVQGLKTTILHVGDFDGSGENMCSVLREDAGAMVASQVLRSMVRTLKTGKGWTGVTGDIWGIVERAAKKEVNEKDWLTLYNWAADWFEVERVALTGEQVIERIGTDSEIETAPAKKKDSRTNGFIRDNLDVVDALGHEDISAQLEALTPPELEALISAEIESQLDMDLYAEKLKVEAEVRDEILDSLTVAGLAGTEDDGQRERLIDAVTSELRSLELARLTMPGELNEGGGEAGMGEYVDLDDEHARTIAERIMSAVRNA